MPRYLLKHYSGCVYEGAVCMFVICNVCREVGTYFSTLNIKLKVDNWDFIKIKKVCLLKVITEKVKMH